MDNQLIVAEDNNVAHVKNDIKIRLETSKHALVCFKLLKNKGNTVVEALEYSLVQLQEECGDKLYADCVSTLLKIFGNVAKNPGEVKFKEIKIDNKTFGEKVWQFKAAQQLLIATGWSEVDDRIILLDDQYVESVVQTLEQINRQLNSSSSGIPAPNKQKTQKNPVADENRRKQYEQMKREKEERQRIAEQIKADRRETQSRPTKDSVARPRKFGANINRFEDIGVDLNKGGG